MGTLTAILAALQAGTGIWQLIKGEQAKDTERHDYKVPKEVTDMLGIAKNQAYGNMPGYQQWLSNFEQQSATGLSRARESASSGSDLLGYVSSNNAFANRNINSLGSSNATYHQQALDKLKSALLTTSKFREKEFQVNELQPYLDAMKTSSVMTEGGLNNIFNALSGYTKNSMMSEMLGLGKTKSTTNTTFTPSGGSFIDSMPNSNWGELIGTYKLA